MTNIFTLGPVPPYNNPPIQPQFFKPSVFTISGITLGRTTIVETLEDMNYVIGQIIRLLIPNLYGASQLNMRQGLVISIISPNQVEIDIDSSKFNQFNSDPISADITGASQTNPCVLTCSSSFLPDQYVIIDGVGGMVELNGRTFFVLASNSTTLTIDIDATSFAAYTSGGEATLSNYLTTKPQIIAIGDVNTGQINSNGSMMTSKIIPGSFQNISPL